MQILQDWNKFRWSRITLLCDPAAKLTRMKVHALSDSTLCDGVSNPEPSNNWVTKLEDVWNEHGFVQKFNLAAQVGCPLLFKVSFFGYTQCSSTAHGRA